MLNPSPISSSCAAVLLLGLGGGWPTLSAGDYPLRPVPFTDVRCNDGFWAPRLDTNRRITLYHNFKQCEEHGQLLNFAKAGGLMPGEFRARPPRDSDIYKIIEGASAMLAVEPDPRLERYLDELIRQIAAAQEPDGYLYTARRLLPPEQMPAISGPERWLNLRHSHELYVAGHLYEAAVAHVQATGKRTLLDVALKNADLVVRTFGPGRLRLPPGHQGIEIGLAKLYRLTSDSRYLALDKFLIDLRGHPETHELFGPYCQDHLPVQEQTEAVGHAVRAGYLYSGMADLSALSGDPGYQEALDRIWTDVVTRKLSLTGGIGPRRNGEAFGEAYELPNARAYNETCGAVANALWNYRMFLRHGDARTIDVFERVVYNGFLSGVGLSGDRFFYENPLASDGGHRRSPWFGTPCCPVNVVRFLPALPGCVYATRGPEVFVNLYVNSTAELTVEDRPLRITQTTDYPWEGRITVSLQPEGTAEFTLRLRIPGWARNQPVPSDLYRFVDTHDAQPSIRINGHPVSAELENGYARIHRRWQPGDAVELTLPMPIRRVLAHPKVQADLGRVALQRGPLVYCVEGTDHPDGVEQLILPDDAPLTAQHHPELLGGVTVILGTSGRPGDTASTGSPPAAFTAIPYYAWAHREDGPMAVWLQRSTANTD